MDLSAARSLFDEFLGNKDTTDLLVSTADKDALINEAYLGVSSQFSQFLEYSQDVTTAANPFSYSTSLSSGFVTGRMAVRIEAMEWKSGGRYMPLKRLELRQVGILRATEDATGNPTSYGMALNTRELNPNLNSTYRVRVYPRPTGSQTYRFLIQFWPLELILVTDTLKISDALAAAVPRIAAWRAGATLGYPEAWLDEMLKPLDDQIRAGLMIAYGTRWTIPKGYERGVVTLEKA